jgi:hypothetical protein
MSVVKGIISDVKGITSLLKEIIPGICHLSCSSTSVPSPPTNRWIPVRPNSFAALSRPLSLSNHRSLHRRSQTLARHQNLDLPMVYPTAHIRPEDEYARCNGRWGFAGPHKTITVAISETVEASGRSIKRRRGPIHST